MKPAPISDARVFGAFYITRREVRPSFCGEECGGCGHQARQGEEWGDFDNAPYCPACCDAEEARHR